MDFILIAVIVLGAIGLIAAVVLFAASKKFAVYEDPRIAQVGEVLPGANCGGCGFPGCSGMADALVQGADAGSLDGLFCPVGGAETMGKVADLLGMAIANSEPMVAVVRCNGTCEHRPRIAEYAGLRTCAATHACGGGEPACGFGCLGCGDCEAVCQFDAIHVNPETGIPEVDEDKCTSCGACVKACKVSCIGCGKCEKECPFGAITVEGNCSYIDFNKCRLCRKCVTVCPTKAIHDVNFPTPAPAPKPKEPVAPKPAAPKADAPKQEAPKQEAPKPAQPSRGALLDTESSISIK